MQKSNKLNGKDLINVGIYTAMTLVIFFVFGLLTSLPVIYPFLLFIWPFVCGIPMMLYYTKIQKFGMLTITGVICGLFFFLIGYTWIGLVGWTLGGILADIVLKAGQYKSFKVTFLSYACFCLGMPCESLDCRSVLLGKYSQLHGGPVRRNITIYDAIMDDVCRIFDFVCRRDLRCFARS